MSVATTSTAFPTTNGATSTRTLANQSLLEVLNKFSSSAKADTVFGTPSVVGEHTLIPVARVTWGFGGGSGSAPKKEGRAEEGSGTGGGGGMNLRPLAIIDATQEKVRVVPIVDVQSVIGRVFAFLTVAVIAGTIAGRQRARRRTRLNLKRMAVPLAIGALAVRRRQTPSLLERLGRSLPPRAGTCARSTKS